MSCMVPVNSTEASERAYEALLRRREEKMALTPIKLVVWLSKDKQVQVKSIIMHRQSVVPYRYR